MTLLAHAAPHGNTPVSTVSDDGDKIAPSSLVSRNITVMGHRTSMRLEPAMWDALIEICRREKLTIHQLCDIVAEKKPLETSFTAAMRVFAMSYFRNASTEDGHSKAGHGSAFLFSAKNDFAGLMPRGASNAPSKPVPASLATGLGMRRY